MSGAGSSFISRQLATALSSAKRVVVFTGAGVSAESGIPTFRDELTGLWKQFDPSELATPKAFSRDPALVWGWYEWRRMKVLQAQPNPAHVAIAELARRLPKLTVITQNVDALHERAGSTGVIHLHGSLHEPRCFACGRPYLLGADIPVEPEDGRRVEPPRCLKCNGKVRPGVVWFGEMLPEMATHVAFEAASECDFLLSIGTSGAVYPAAQIPSIARQVGAVVVHINPQSVAVWPQREYSLIGLAGEVLPALIAEAFGG
jgi:NAD-dependent deacetylase